MNVLALLLAAELCHGLQIVLQEYSVKNFQISPVSVLGGSSLVGLISSATTIYLFSVNDVDVNCGILSLNKENDGNLDLFSEAVVFKEEQITYSDLKNIFSKKDIKRMLSCAHPADSPVLYFP